MSVIGWETVSGSALSSELDSKEQQTTAIPSTKKLEVKCVFSKRSQRSDFALPKM